MYKESRSWMYNRYVDIGRGLTQEFKDGVNEFVTFALGQHQYMDGSKIRCPCMECKNRKFVESDEVYWHLYTHGFIDNYYNWISQGEPLESYFVPQTVGMSRYVPEEMSTWGNYEDMSWDQ
ncbi:unnamed protein product, partial [Cuscuta epithymum]